MKENRKVKLISSASVATAQKRSKILITWFFSIAFNPIFIDARRKIASKYMFPFPYLTIMDELSQMKAELGLAKVLKKNQRGQNVETGFRADRRSNLRQEP